MRITQEAKRQNRRKILAMTMVVESMEEGRQTYLKRRSGEESLIENLFLVVASELRALHSHRLSIGPVLESGMSVFAKHSNCPAGEQARLAHPGAVGSSHAKIAASLLNYVFKEAYP